MSSITYSDFHAVPQRPIGILESTGLMLLFFAVLSGGAVVIELGYVIAIIVLIGYFTMRGLRVEPSNIVLFLFLAVYNLGALMSIQPYLSFELGVEFVIGTCFVAVSAVFFALLLNENALERLNTIKWGYVWGAMIASIAGILGYFNIFGLAEQFTKYTRATGTFKDPNVLGPFLVMPILYLMWDVFSERQHRFKKLILLSVLMLALLLSFSRGAWIGFIIGSVLVFGIKFLVTDSPRLRSQIVLSIGAALIIGAIFIGIAMLEENIRTLLLDRFTLSKDYDSGPSGRFGNQLRSIPLLLERIFGFGPNRFPLYFPENPHNIYIHSFSSYGWLGGLTYFAFIATTLWMSFYSAFQKSPYQHHAIIILASLFPHMVQGIQIDTDKWRHLFMIYGLAWGIAGVIRRHRMNEINARGINQ
jgi:hypothetical protein